MSRLASCLLSSCTGSRFSNSDAHQFSLIVLRLAFLYFIVSTRDSVHAIARYATACRPPTK